MQPVVIYTTPLCGYCLAAKRLLERRGIAFEEIDVAGRPGRRAEMAARAGGRASVPQAFVGATHVGGFRELAALDADGRLRALVGAPG